MIARMNEYGSSRVTKMYCIMYAVCDIVVCNMVFFGATHKIVLAYLGSDWPFNYHLIYMGSALFSFGLIGITVAMSIETRTRIKKKERKKKNRKRPKHRL